MLQIANARIYRQTWLMKAARIIRFGFFLTGFATLAVIFLGIGGWIGFALSIALTMPFTALIMFGLKCPSCGVSYFFEPSKDGWNLTGINLLAPVADRCRKCGTAR